MNSLLSQNSYLPLTTQSKIDTMDEIDYAFYLAYGMTQQDEELDSLLDVEMYNTLGVDVTMPVEESYRDVLASDA
jgi:hypothetical protein